MTTKPDLILLGPAPPYRGGIAETNHELAIALEQAGKCLELWTFKKLYPKIIFPGSSPFSKEAQPKLNVYRKIHAYAPFHWKRVANQISKQSPKVVIFRYYTPFLALCYGYIAHYLNPKIECVALVDNWIPHERKPWDRMLNRFFGKRMHRFMTLSSNVTHAIKQDFAKPIWTGFHPISKQLPDPISMPVAKKKLGWSPQEQVVLFFGLVRKYKGLDLLIQAFATSCLKNTSIRLAIVGEFYEDINRYKKTDFTIRIARRCLVLS